jgi:lambda repressor-like predicted transcriptional regulator
MIWSEADILQAIRKQHKAGRDLSYNRMARQMQSLVSAAAYHFGSYRKAVERAGIDYDEVTRRPRWTRQRIVALIKSARRRGEDLHWSAVVSRRDELGKAAFASLQSRLFGRWDRALAAAGLDAQKISKYRQWNPESIVAEFRTRGREKRPLNSGAIQSQNPALHAAAVRHFGSFDAALTAAHLDPVLVRQRKSWTRAEVVKSIRAVHRSGKSLADSSVRRESPAVYGAAVRLFGTFITARKAAGVKFNR